MLWLFRAGPEIVKVSYNHCTPIFTDVTFRNLEQETTQPLIYWIPFLLPVPEWSERDAELLIRSTSDSDSVSLDNSVELSIHLADEMNQKSNKRIEILIQYRFIESWIMTLWSWRP